MDWGSPLFVLAIIAITTLGWVMTTAIRAKHGYPLEDDMGGLIHKAMGDGDEQTKALVDENKQLHQTVEKLEDRIKVLERIATDPAKRLEEDIERLR